MVRKFVRFEYVRSMGDWIWSRRNSNSVATLIASKPYLVDTAMPERSIFAPVRLSRSVPTSTWVEKFQRSFGVYSTPAECISPTGTSPCVYFSSPKMLVVSE